MNEDESLEDALVIAPEKYPLGTASKKKIRDYLGTFPNMGGVFPIPKTCLC